MLLDLPGKRSMFEIFKANDTLVTHKAEFRHKAKPLYVTMALWRSPFFAIYRPA